MWWPPGDESKPALLCTAQVCVPIELADLPQRVNPAPWRTSPRYKPGEVDIADAKAVVHHLARHIDAQAAPVVAALH
jgi:hypothetical protein